MDRRAAGALLALAACIASSAAAPTASDHTALDVYEGGSEGCYYNFQHYGEGDRIMTNEPCLNCTCHNRMLMCYLRVCPFTKPIGQDCTVEKRADQCCPIVTCPDVPVDLLTSTSTTSPAEYGATGLGKLDKYGCSINGKYFPEGSKVPPTPNKPCEHCYCIRNMTTCVMQECTLHVDGCTPIYHKDVCCPIRYSCDHPQDEVLLLDDMSTTVRPTPGFLLTTTTVSPVTQMSQDCVHNDQIIADGASITTEKACEHCYCMKGDIVCVVQGCGAPMENEGKNCTSLPPRVGQCCPDTYICEGDDISTEIPYISSTDELLEKFTTLLPPRKSGLEGSGYRNEPNEATYTEMPYVEPELEGSGEEGLDATKPPEGHESSPGKPFGNEEITTNGEDVDQYIPVTTKAPVYKEPETSTEEVGEETIEPQKYSTSGVPKEDINDTNIGVTHKVNLPQEYVTTSASLPENYDQYTTGSIDSVNTVPDISPEKEHYDHTSRTTDIPPLEDSNPVIPQENKETESATSTSDQDLTLNPISEITSKPDSTTDSEISERIDTSTTERTVVTSEPVTQKEYSETENDLGGITEASITDRTYTISPEQQVTNVVKDIIKHTESNKPEHYNPSTTNTPTTEIEKLTTELNVEQNTVIAVEKDSHYPHITEATEKASDLESTEKAIIDNVSKPEEHTSTVASVLRESEFTVEPDKGLNTIPSETDEETHPSLVELTVSPVEMATTKSPNLVDRTPAQEVETSSVPSEISTLFLESHITKSDHYTVTTEPSFRKEDETVISTEKPKEEFGSTTIKTEFVDEGLIPTSIHDEKLSTNTDITFTYEEMTTAEYNKELEESTSPKQDTTTPSILETSGTAGILPEKVTATNELDSTSSPSTEKSPDATSLMPVEDIHEEPSRIPGEGDCLLNGVTYRNNTSVPNTNNCHTGCKCVSSIIKCDPIICSPPPEYMSNCQSIYDTPDSCCPTYICDHPRETIPPQSDNQMSGTEAPIITPTIECRGDQCELSIPSKPTTPSESCSSDNCVSAPGDKTGPVNSECGPTGCDNGVKEPVEPSVEQPQCANGKCETSREDCANGKCQLLPTDSKLPSVKPCDGDDCRIADEKSQIPQLCENEENCKKIEGPVNEPASNVNCGSGSCDPNIISPPHANEPELCKDNDSCKPEDDSTFDCTGDKPCRRKDSSVAEMLPPKCEGDDCAQKIDTPIEQDIPQTHTVSPSLETITETIVSVKDEKVSASTDAEKLEQEKIETTTVTKFVTEEQYVPTEFMVSKIDTETKPVSITEATVEEQKEGLTEPTLIEKEPTKNANDLDNYTDTSISIGEVSTQLPKEIQNIEENQTTHAPEVVTKGHTVKPPLGQQEDITVPIENDREQTDKQEPTDTEVTKTFDDFTHKPSDLFTLSEESSSEISDVTREYSHTSTQTPDVASDAKEPTTVDTKKPDIIEQHKDEPIPVTKEVDYVTPYTDKPQLNIEKETELPSTFEKEAEHKVTTVQEESTNIPSIIEGHNDDLTEIPDVINEHTDKVIVTEIPTDEPISVTEKETKTSDRVGSDYTDKPSVTEEQSTKLPDITEKQHTDTTTSSEEESTKIPKATEKYYEPTDVLENHTDEVPTINDFATKAPHVTDEQSYVPVYITEKGTDSPSYAIDNSDKPTLSEEQDMKIPHIHEIEPDDKLIPVEEKSTKSPQIIEDNTEDSVTVPGIMKEQTDESTEIPEAGNETGGVVEEYTNKPAVTTENVTKSSPYDGEESYQTSSPEETERPDDKKKPILFEEELPGKTDDMKEITEKKPDFNENEGVTEPVIPEESSTENLKAGTTKKPVLIDETAPDEFEVSTEDSPIITEKPSTENLNLPNDKVVGEVTEGPSPVTVDEVSTSSEVEHTYKPDIFELHTNAPEPKTTEPQGHSYQTPDEEQSSTKAPGTFQTETKVPESVMEDSTKTTDMKLEKVTEVPVHEVQTTGGEENVNTVQEVTPKSPSTSGSSVIVPQDSGSDLTNVDNMETVTKQQETTDVPSTVTISSDTLPPLREEDQMIHEASKDITPTQEPVTSKQKTDETPDITLTTESVEKVTKPTEYESDHEEKEGFTGIPEQEPKPSSTKSPTDLVIEPQEGEEPQLPDVVKAGPTDEQSSTKPLEDENIKSSTPESHAPGITAGTEYGHTTILAETDSVTEVVERETPNIRLPEPHDNDLVHISTNAPISTITEDVKIDSSDVNIPQKEDMTTSITESTNTVAPAKGFTETEDVSITDEEHTSNELTENTTEHLELYTTAQIDINSETLPSISKTTNGPEQSYTDSHIGHTAIPVQTESESTETYEKSTTFKFSEVSQKTSDSNELVSEQPHRRTETIEQENTTPLTSEIQHSSITSTPTEITDDVVILEENTTKSPESYPQMHSDVTTKVPEIYGTSEPNATESSQPQEPTSEVTEGLKTTGSFYSESHMTDDQKTEPLDTENATILPVSPTKSDSETLRPETDVHKSSTEVPAMFTEILTEMSHTEITTVAPLSMVTEHQPDVSVTSEKHDDTKTTSQEIETATQQQTTERENDVTLLHEITTDKQKEITKPADKTTTGSEYSETTPYLIELEEHTHKITDDISTISPADEKESTYNTDDVISTTSTSQEHHVDEHNITPSPTEEEHTVKIEDHLSTASTSDENLTHEVLEDTSPASQPAGDIKTATELHDLEKVTEKIPEEKLEIITKQPEIASSSSEEPSTVLGVTDETSLTESNKTDLETKPARDQTTQVPAISEDDEVDKKDLTTRKPSQDLEITVPAIVIDTEKSPIVESDGDVPSTSAGSDKTTASIDESVFSTTKPATVKQEELLTPSSEDKYSQPEEKPSGEAFSPTSTAEVPKPPVDIEPTEEIPTPEDDGLSSGMTGYGEPDYAEEDQAFGPGTCRYGGKVYVSAQQIPRDDPCDFCFCFRSDIICLQQSCPPPIHGCHEEPIQGFCCPRYECPVSMATTVNVTTTTTTTTTTLPPHFPTHGYKGAAQRRGCQIKGHIYKVGEVVRSSSGPCLHCTCGGDGQMKCDPKACTPEPMLRQMIAAAVSAKRRR